MNPYKPTSSAPHTGEILQPASIHKIEDDPLPNNPLASGLNGTGLSISGMVNKARTRAELSREAMQIYKHAVIESMRQQADVILQGRELTVSAMKRGQFERFLSANAELVDRLWDRLEEMVNAMKDGELRTIIAAEEEAQQRQVEINQKVDTEVIDRDAGDRLIAVIDEHRLYKARSALDRCAEFLDELKRQMTVTIRQLEVDSKRFL